MGSPFLTNIGLGNMDLGGLILFLIILNIVSITVLVVFIMKNKKLMARYRKFMQGSKAVSLEEQIWNIADNVMQLNDEVSINTQDINTLFEKQVFAFQKLGLVKYDAYKESGGKLSYALTLLDEKNNGFLINSINTSTGCYSYTKRIKSGRSEIDLSPEERNSLEKAMGVK